MVTEAVVIFESSSAFELVVDDFRLCTAEEGTGVVLECTP